MARLINKLCAVFLLVLFTLNGCSAQNIAYFEGYDLVFNDEKYIVDFLFKLNKIRMNNTIFKQKENFNILIEFFNHIFSKLKKKYF